MSYQAKKHLTKFNTLVTNHQKYRNRGELLQLIKNHLQNVASNIIFNDEY